MTTLTREQIVALRIYADTAGKKPEDLSAFEILMAAKAAEFFDGGLIKPDVLRALCDDALIGLAVTPRPQFDAMAPAIRSAAKNQGYAVAVHGSLNRDIDLIAVLWRDGAQNADKLTDVICGAVTGVVGSCSKHGEDWTLKPHGRKARTLMVYCGENHMQIDLSVMPTIAPKPKMDETTP